MTIDEAARHRVDGELAALHAAEYGSLLRLAALLVDDRSSCEDVVQEAFVRVCLAWRRLDHYDNALAYLRQTVVNVSRSALRRRIVAARLAPRPAAAYAADAADEAYAGFERDTVVRALRRLPRRQREAIVLRYYADLSVEETARAMGCGVGSVKAYTSRGMATLSARLHEELA